MESAAVRVPTTLGEVAVRVVGEGRPTVLWHSMFVDGSSWDRLVPLIHEGRRLLVVDGPGWGRSAPLRSTTTVSASVGTAVEVLRVLAPDGPVDWIGNAWGGHIGMELAATRPELIRSLIAISSPPQPIDRRLATRIRLLIPVLRLVGMAAPVRSAVLDGILTAASQQRPELVAVVVDAMRRVGRVSAVNASRSFILRRPDITGLLPRIEAPGLFVVGDDRGDWTAEQAAEAAALVPSIRPVVIPGSRTLVPLEQPHRLAAEILAFWTALA